jgi:biopolymer transport protein ExbD
MSSLPPSPRISRKLSAYHPTRPLKLWQDHTHDQGETRIEMVPLIDIIFCILIFFLLGAVGLSRQQAISMDLPKASTGKPQMREMLVVSLDDLGQLFVEKQPVTENQLFDTLKNYRQYNPAGLMVLHASRNASYNDVVHLLDVLRQVGGDRVALATLPGEAQKPSDFGGFSNPNTGVPSAGSTPNNYGSAFPNNLGSPSSSFPTTMPGAPNATIPGLPANAPIPGSLNPTDPTFPRSSSIPPNPNSALVPANPSLPGMPNQAPDQLPRR